MLTHLFFDFFGTLVDYSPSRTEQGYPRSYRIVLDAGAEFTYADFLARWDQVAGRVEAEAEKSQFEYSMHDVCGRFLREVLQRPPPGDLLDRFIDCYITEWNRGVGYLPGLAEMLERLSRRYRLAVITNTHSAGLVPEHLLRMGVAGAFEGVITSVEHGRRKPHPEIFAHALVRLGTNPAASAYIGDSLVADYQGSRAAGMTAFLIDPAASAAVPADARLRNVLELESRLEQFA